MTDSSKRIRKLIAIFSAIGLAAALVGIQSARDLILQRIRDGRNPGMVESSSTIIIFFRRTRLAGIRTPQRLAAVMTPRRASAM